MIRITSFLSLLLLFGCPQTIAGSTCGSKEDAANCINATSQGAQSFAFPPLFPANPTLIYAVDQVSDESQKIAFWLQYSAINLTNSALETSQVAMLFTNASGTVSGDNNGCNGVLGEQCVTNLKDLLKSTILRRSNEYLSNVTALYDSLKALQPAQLSNLSCPSDLFDDSPLVPATLVDGNFQEQPLAVEVTRAVAKYDYLPAHLPSGNASYTYSEPIDRKRSYDEQINKVGVGIIVRFPLSIEMVYDMASGQYEGGSNTTYNTIQMDMVCLRAAGNGTSDSANSVNGSTATRPRILFALAWIVAAIVYLGFL